MAQASLQQQIIAAKTKRMLDRLSMYYKLGRQANRPNEKESPEELGARHGMSRDQVRKIRVFARQYSPQQFRTLCMLRRPSGLPLHWGYVIALQAVQEPA